MDGYYRLACLMGRQPDLAIFRKFRTSHALVVLILQAEVIALEHALGEYAEKERALDIRDGVKPRRDESVEVWKQEQSRGELSTSWKIVTELREKLKEYDQAVTRFRAIGRQPPVRRKDVDTLQTWLDDANGGHKFLTDIEQTTWQDASDLTPILDSGEHEDAVSRWINGPLIHWYHRKIGHRYKKKELPLFEPCLSNEAHMTPLYVYDEKTITTVVSGLSTVLASLLPCLSIFLLYFVRFPVIRLSIILVLSLLFSIVMSLVATAKRSECFAATSAFAAVLVVFVGSNDSNA